jgi:hypothetical protein
MDLPQLVNFIYIVSGKLDIFKFSQHLQEYDERKRRRDDVDNTSTKKKRPYMRRRVYQKRDPKTSFWWIDYVKDPYHTWRDETHRNGKYFRYRFSHSFDSVHEIVKKIHEPEHYFWRNKFDSRGREACPIHLLVLGSLRILTRNVTLDDLQEQTFISKVCRSV